MITPARVEPDVANRATTAIAVPIAAGDHTLRGRGTCPSERWTTAARVGNGRPRTTRNPRMSSSGTSCAVPLCGSHECWVLR